MITVERRPKGNFLIYHGLCSTTGGIYINADDTNKGSGHSFQTKFVKQCLLMNNQFIC